MLNKIKYITLIILLMTFYSLLMSLCLADENQNINFDYFDYALVLKTYVNEQGLVNYRKLKAEPQMLERFVAAMGELDPNSYSKYDNKERIAFWLNAYNALTLKVIIDNYPIKSSFFKSLYYPKNSIRQIDGVWDKITFDVMGQKLTLEHIEHEILRKDFHEPRIHMALVCAAMGCPLLRNKPYIGKKLDQQHDDQGRKFLNNPEKFKIDKSRNTVYLSPVFKWFAKDFVENYGDETIRGKSREDSAVLNFVSRYLSPEDKKFIQDGGYKIEYLKYDWLLNEQ